MMKEQPRADLGLVFAKYNELSNEHSSFNLLDNEAARWLSGQRQGSVEAA